MSANIRALELPKQLKKKYPFQMGLKNLLNKDAQEVFINYLRKMFTGKILFEAQEVASVLEGIEVGAVERFDGGGPITTRIILKSSEEPFSRVADEDGVRWYNYADICAFLVKYLGPVISMPQGRDYLKRSLDYYIGLGKIQEAAYITNLLCSIDVSQSSKREKVELIGLLNKGLEHLSAKQTIVGNEQKLEFNIVDNNTSIDVTNGWVQIMANYFSSGYAFRETTEPTLASLISLEEIAGHFSLNTQYTIEEGYAAFDLNILEMVFYAVLLSRDSECPPLYPEKVSIDALQSLVNVFGIEQVEAWHSEALKVDKSIIESLYTVKENLNKLTGKLEEMRIVCDKIHLDKILDTVAISNNRDSKKFKV